jgi:uncharacterized protein (DUF433 family)
VYRHAIICVMREDPRINHDRITEDPTILGGKPIVRGTRIAVSLILEELAQNLDIRELLAAHPDLTRTDVQACQAYAQALIDGGKRERLLPPKSCVPAACPILL